MPADSCPSPEPNPAGARRQRAGHQIALHHPARTHAPDEPGTSPSVPQPPLAFPENWDTAHAPQSAALHSPSSDTSPTPSCPKRQTMHAPCRAAHGPGQSAQSAHSHRAENGSLQFLAQLMHQFRGNALRLSLHRQQRYTISRLSASFRRTQRTPRQRGDHFSHALTLRRRQFLRSSKHVIINGQSRPHSNASFIHHASIIIHQIGRYVETISSAPGIPNPPNNFHPSCYPLNHVPIPMEDPCRIRPLAHRAPHRLNCVSLPTRQAQEPQTHARQHNQNHSTQRA